MKLFLIGFSFRFSTAFFAVLLPCLIHFLRPLAAFARLPGGLLDAAYFPGASPRRSRLLLGTCPVPLSDFPGATHRNHFSSVFRPLRLFSFLPVCSYSFLFIPITSYSFPIYFLLFFPIPIISYSIPYIKRRRGRAVTYILKGIWSYG